MGGDLRETAQTLRQILRLVALVKEETAVELRSACPFNKLVQTGALNSHYFKSREGGEVKVIFIGQPQKKKRKKSNSKENLARASACNERRIGAEGHSALSANFPVGLLMNRKHLFERKALFIRVYRKGEKMEGWGRGQTLGQ